MVSRLAKDRFFIIVLIFVAMGVFFPYTELATEMLIFGMLAVSFNLMLGYAGLLSFCHAALFAVGAYTMGILLVRLNINLFAGILAAGLLSSLAATIIGWISIKRHGIYFAMLTLAFNEVIYFSILELREITGGDDGLRDIFRPDLDFGLFSITIQTPVRFYFFTLFIFVVSIIILRRITESPFGRVLLGIRENEQRAQTVGYNTRDYKLLIFIISGFVAGVAGSLFCIHIRYADLSFAHWSFSGEVIIMTLVGGINSLYGPILGAGLVSVMQDFFSNVWDRWLLVLGFIFVVFVMGFPGGIWEGIERLIRYIQRK